MAGVGIEMLSLKPRTEATGENNKKFQVDERITTLSYEAHVKYTNKDWFVGAKVFWVPISHRLPVWADSE